MSSYSDTVKRWLAVEQGTESRFLTNRRMPCERGTIYSYGRHFPLAEALRDKRGRITTFLLNGDRFSVTTNRHQREVRTVLQTSGIPCVIVPFEALRAANIDRGTIRTIDVRDDRTETIIDSVEWFDTDLIEWGPRETRPYADVVFQEGIIPGRPELNATRYLRAYDYKACAFVDYDNPEVSIYRNGSGVEWDTQNEYHVKRYRHWLGDSVFKAKVGNAWRTFISSFDYQERMPLYFLAEIPRGANPQTVEDAILALSPRIVHAAIAQGRDVKRQGDMFAIPTVLTTADVKRRCDKPIERMVGIMGTDHVVTESVTGKGGVTYARGTIHHRPGGDADHRRVKLGQTWHLMVPNAVPRRRGAMVRFGR